MPDIKITVHSKTAHAPPDAVIVGDNSDYIMTFAFDATWQGAAPKTARYVWTRGNVPHHHDEPIVDDKAAVPLLHGVRLVAVGVFAGNLKTTTPAIISVEPSILDGDTNVEESDPVIWARILGMIGDPSALITEDKSSLVGAINEVAAKAGTGGGSGGVSLPPGGKAGQVLTKASDADGDVIWADPQIPPEYGLITYYQDRKISVT